MSETFSADLVVYGGMSAAVTAAVQAARMGKSVLMVSPDRHLGGLSAGGLGWTDSGHKGSIGGLSREFYHRVWRHYGQDAAWFAGARAAFPNAGQGTKAIDDEDETAWTFEPHVAEAVFEAMLSEAGVTVRRNEWLDREKGIERDADRLTAFRTLSGARYAAKQFIDATYEGDLMAAAGLPYHAGREGREVYGEQWNGVQKERFHHGHSFLMPISPYRVPDDPRSGLLPRISAEPPGDQHAGDHRVQAYCFRMCLTNHDANRVPFPKPEGYDPDEYELALRVFAAGWREHFGKFDHIPNFKTDTNNHGPFSTDNIGRNYGYPDGDYATRRAIIAEHRQYQQGLMYFLANDPRMPADVREAIARWGLPKDEFTDNGNWSHQLYIREARRLKGQSVITEHEVMGTKPVPYSVGMGSYTIDSHHTQRYVTSSHTVQNEGDIGVHTPGPYAIDYHCLTPKRGDLANLLVPVCLSSSHAAYGSVRMEPVFMILGQSAATAAVAAMEENSCVQDIDLDRLTARLLADGQVLRHG